MLSQKIIIYPSTAAQGQPNGDRSQGGTSMRPHSDSCRSGADALAVRPAKQLRIHVQHERGRQDLVQIGHIPLLQEESPLICLILPLERTGEHSMHRPGDAAFKRRGAAVADSVQICGVTASKTRTPAVLRTVPSAETGSCTGKLPPNCRSCRSSAVWKAEHCPAFA